MWDYATLSQKAKACGGPEKYIQQIRKDGRYEMIPFIGVAFIAGGIATKYVPVIKKKWQDHKIKTMIAEQEIINGIKEYDKQQEETIVDKQ